MFKEIAPLTVEIEVWAQPGSSRSQIVGSHGKPPKLKIQIAASAVENTANEELVRFLSKLLKAQVEIVRGHHSRTKTIRVHGLALAQLQAKLGVSG